MLKVHRNYELKASYEQKYSEQWTPGCYKQIIILSTVGAVSLSGLGSLYFSAIVKDIYLQTNYNKLGFI
jgi:hypothetical protein